MGFCVWDYNKLNAKVNSYHETLNTEQSLFVLLQKTKVSKNVFDLLCLEFALKLLQ